MQHISSVHTHDSDISARVGDEARAAVASGGRLSRHCCLGLGAVCPSMSHQHGLLEICFFSNSRCCRWLAFFVSVKNHNEVNREACNGHK
jgi:hypothetical protein